MRSRPGRSRQAAAVGGTCDGTYESGRHPGGTDWDVPLPDCLDHDLDGFRKAGSPQ